MQVNIHVFLIKKNYALPYRHIFDTREKVGLPMFVKALIKEDRWLRSNSDLEPLIQKHQCVAYSITPTKKSTKQQKFCAASDVCQEIVVV